MTYLAKPRFHHPTLQKNAVGYTRRDYEGKVSTLCAGCGHDSISAALIQAFWELDIQPHRVAKLSGIGCSSKTPDYFLGNSHGFNTVHGRMPSVLTGAKHANPHQLYQGVSGDGDTATIGLGQFAHAQRRGEPADLLAGVALGRDGRHAHTGDDPLATHSPSPASRWEWPRRPVREVVPAAGVVAEVVAHYGKPLSMIIEEMELEFGTLHYDRRDVSRRRATRIASTLAGVPRHARVAVATRARGLPPPSTARKGACPSRSRARPTRA